jgi:hypothetical protein
VILLVSNVIFGLCGSFFEKWWMPSQITGEKAIVSDSKFIPAEQGIEDICMWKSCIVLGEG